MISTLIPRKLPTYWAQAVMGSPWRSAPFLFAAVSNLTAIEILLQNYFTYRKATAYYAFLLTSLAFFAFLLLMAGFVMYRIYKQTQAAILAGGEDAALDSLLRVSYEAFRLYVLFLGALTMGLGFANLMAV